MGYSLLLLAETDRLSSPTSCLGVLTLDTKIKVVPDTPVSSAPLQSLDVISELGVEIVREDLERLAVNDVYKCEKRVIKVSQCLPSSECKVCFERSAAEIPSITCFYTCHDVSQCRR